jgi:hypothetical protein
VQHWDPVEQLAPGAPHDPPGAVWTHIFAVPPPVRFTVSQLSPAQQLPWAPFVPVQVAP